MIPFVISVIEDDDDRAFAEQIYVKYRKLMLSEIQKVTENAWDAEDVLQSAVEKLIDRLSFLRTLDRPHMVNYMITTCRNTAISLLREQKRHPQYSFEEVYDSEGEEAESQESLIESQIIIQQTNENLRAAWRNISTDSRIILSGKYMLDQSDAEIAQQLGIKASSVRMALTRARRELRKQIIQIEGITTE